MTCLAAVAFAVIAAPLPPAPAAAPADEAQIMFEMRLIQLHPDAQRSLSFEGDVLIRQVPLLGEIPLIGELFESHERESFSVISADEALIRRGDETWKLLGDARDDDAPFDILTAPRLITSEFQEAFISMGQQVHYLEWQDGCLQVVECDGCFEGIQIGITPGEATRQRVVIDELSVEISTIVEREAVDDVPLDVGRPIMRTREVESAFTIAPDQVLVMPIADPDGEDDGEPILMVLQVQVLR